MPEFRQNYHISLQLFVYYYITSFRNLFQRFFIVLGNRRYTDAAPTGLV